MIVRNEYFGTVVVGALALALLIWLISDALSTTAPKIQQPDYVSQIEKATNHVVACTAEIREILDMAGCDMVARAVLVVNKEGKMLDECVLFDLQHRQGYSEKEAQSWLENNISARFKQCEVEIIELLRFYDCWIKPEMLFYHGGVERKILFLPNN